MNHGQKKKDIEPLHIALLLIFLVTLLWSVIHPKDLFTWFLEVLPALIGLAAILITYNRD